MQEGDRVTRVLVTGAKGQLGSRLVELGARRKTLQVVGLGQTDLDITDPSSIQEALSRHTPDVVVNAAAYTAVDLAEFEQGTRLRHQWQRGEASGRGLQPKRSGFDSLEHGLRVRRSGTRALGPSEPTGPLGVYGASKLEGEEAFLASGVHGAVVRVAWLYDARGSNFLTTMLRLANQHGTVEGGERPTRGPHFRPGFGGGVARHGRAQTSHAAGHPSLRPRRTHHVARIRFGHRGACRIGRSCGGCDLRRVSHRGHPAGVECVGRRALAPGDGMDLRTLAKCPGGVLEIAGGRLTFGVHERPGSLEGGQGQSAGLDPSSPRRTHAAHGAHLVGHLRPGRRRP